MNTHPGIRIARPWIKVRIAKSPCSRLHSKPPKNEPAPVQDKADEDITEQARTRLRKGSPEYRAHQSEIMKRRWAQPDFRKKASAALRGCWSSPEKRALRSEFFKNLWARSGYKEKHSAAVREARSNVSPEEREKRNAIRRETWSPETRKEASLRAKRDWSNMPKRKETLSAFYKIPENKDLWNRKKLFRRDDNDPKMKMMWGKMKEEARIFADSLNADELRVEYHNAFIILHLDASQYDSKLYQTATLQKLHRKGRTSVFTDAQVAKLKEKFLENVLSTGLPEVSFKVFDELAKELQCKYLLRQRLNRERRDWLRAAAVLRRKGVDVDYANIPHLAWLEEVGRL